MFKPLQEQQDLLNGILQKALVMGQWSQAFAKEANFSSTSITQTLRFSLNLNFKFKKISNLPDPAEDGWAISWEVHSKAIKAHLASLIANTTISSFNDIERAGFACCEDCTLSLNSYSFHGRAKRWPLARCQIPKNGHLQLRGTSEPSFKLGKIWTCVQLIMQDHNDQFGTWLYEVWGPKPLIFLCGWI